MKIVCILVGKNGERKIVFEKYVMTVKQTFPTEFHEIANSIWELDGKSDQILKEVEKASTYFSRFPCECNNIVHFLLLGIFPTIFLEVSAINYNVPSILLLDSKVMFCSFLIK